MATFTAKTVVIDFADNWGGTDMNVRSIEFKLSGTLIDAGVTVGINCYATTTYSSLYLPQYAFTVGLSKTGAGNVSNAWNSSSGSTTNQRLIVVFDSAQEFDSIVVNNCHHYGSYTNGGVKNTKIYVSPNSVTDTTYGATVSGGILVFDGQIAEHAAADVVDDQILTLIEPITSAPDAITTGSPVVGSPGVIEIVNPNDLVSGNPVVGSPTPFGVPIGVPVNLVTGYPVVGSPGVIVISPGDSIVTGSPVVGSPGVIEIAYVTGITSGYPVIGQPTPFPVSNPVGFVAGIPTLGNPSGNFIVTDLNTAFLRYVCVLTGDTDVTLPMSSFQGRCRSGEQTFLSVVIPGIDYADDITDRSEGELIVKANYVVGDVVRLVKELGRVDLTNIEIHDGIKNKSIILTGYKTNTFVSKSVEMTNYTYSKHSTDGYIYRFASPDFFLNPGDEATVNGNTFTVNNISYFVNTFGTTMEIRG